MAGTFLSPKGILLYLKWPNGVEKAVLGESWGSMGIRWNQQARSKIEMYFRPPSWSRIRYSLIDLYLARDSCLQWWCYSISGSRLLYAIFCFLLNPFLWDNPQRGIIRGTWICNNSFFKEIWYLSIYFFMNRRKPIFFVWIGWLFANGKLRFNTWVVLRFSPGK